MPRRTAFSVSESDSRREILERVCGHLEANLVVTQACLEACAGEIASAAHLVLDAVRGGGKVVLFGNGGSAADAQHLAADFVGRLAHERAPIPAVALCADTAVLTALGNDYGFDQVFARQVEALARSGDAVIAISTSGRSANVIAGAAAARRAGARVIALTGQDVGGLAPLVDVAILVPSTSTATIQEAHIAIGHALCAAVEQALGSPDER